MCDVANFFGVGFFGAAAINLLMTDPELLNALRSGASTEAFTETVRRHLPLVLSAARRRLTVPDAAEDVAQQVFTLLAQKASSLAPNVVLAGWLYHTTCHLASEHNRSEGRRRFREQNSMAMTDATHLPAEVEDHWRQLRPVLDDAMQQLSDPDRDAVLLRFFEGRSLDEVGRSLGVTADAAQKRVSRALDRLRETLVRSHPWVTPGTLSAAIAAGVIEATPTELQAAAIAQSALSAAAVHAIAASTATSLSATTAGTSLITMASTQSIVTGALTAALLGMVAWQHFQLSAIRVERNQLIQSAEAASAAAAASTTVLASPTPTVDPELLRLRGEVARMRGLSNELASLRLENNRLQTLRNVSASISESLGYDTRQGVERMQYLKAWMYAFNEYLEKHDGIFPASFEEVTAAGFQVAEGPGFSSGHLEILYKGRLDEVKDPAGVIVLRERELFRDPSGNGFNRTYAFADGHVEIHHSPDEDFSNWEREHRQVTKGTPPTQGL